MGIVITGASGFIGRQLVPRLSALSIPLVLVGRNPAALRTQFPLCTAVDYAGLTEAARGHEVLVHLAAINNNQPATQDVFIRVNADLAVQTCRQALAAGVARFIYVSSTHALENGDLSNYAISKRAAEKELLLIDGIDVEILYLPAVAGDALQGKLGLLNRLPAFLRASVLSLAKAMKPTVHIDTLVRAIVARDEQSGVFRKPRVLADSQDDNPSFRFIKRAMDLTLALGVLACLWWAMIIVWAAVRLQSPGPGVYRQPRVGRHGQVFTCYKFRTMVLSTPDKGTHEISETAVTTLGRFLRRTKLDELPQVFNVLRNEMTFVGPRPSLPSQLDIIRERKLRGILKAKPGITGLSQINGIDMSDPLRLAECDQRYLQLQSLQLDVEIILATLIGRGSGDRVSTNL